MKTMKVTAVATALIASLGSIQTATAEVSGNVALTSNYIWRGTTQNNEDPALQGGFDYEMESGFYAGVWGSNVDFGGDESTEIDLYAGYGFELGALGADVGIIAYKFFGGDNASGDNEEAYIGLSIAGFGLTYSLGIGDNDSDNIELSYGLDITDGLSLALAVGDFDGYGDEGQYYSAGISGSFGNGLGWDVTVADQESDENDTQVALTLSKSL